MDREPVGFIERELWRVETALREPQESQRYERLYAVQQALRWALEPVGFASPYDMVVGHSKVSISSI